MAVPRLTPNLTLATTLASNVNDSVTAIPVVNSKVFSPGGWALIGSPTGTYEVVAVTDTDPGELTVTRGVDASHPAASHTAGVQVIAMERILISQSQLVESTADKVAALLSTAGIDYYVSINGADANDGLTWETAKLTIQAAVNAASAGDRVAIAPGAYDETVSVPASKSDLTIIGAGPRGSAYIEPSTLAAEGMEILADGVTLINVGVAGEATADYALHLGDEVGRFRAHQCKFEGTTGIVVKCTGVGDVIFDDCEFAWGGTGISFHGGVTDSCTQVVIKDSRFHNLTTAHVAGLNANSGTVVNLVMSGTIHDVDEAGAAPTDFILIDAAGCAGIVTGCRFATATNAATILTVPAGILWVSNATGAGFSTSRPA